MKFYFQIKNKEYESIDSDKLTVSQYFIISEIINKKIIDTDSLIELSINLIEEITNIPNEYIKDFTMYSVLQIDWATYISDLSKLKKIKKHYEGFKLKDLDSITFGNYIDIDYFYIQPNEQRIVDVVSLMLLDVDYTKKEFKEMIIKVKEMTLKDILSIFNYYLSYRSNIFKEFKYLFDYEEPTEEDLEVEEEPKEDKSEERQYSNWLENAYMLTNKDITKIETILSKPFIQVLNYLTWMKSENEKENRLIKNINR